MKRKKRVIGLLLAMAVAGGLAVGWWLFRGELSVEDEWTGFTEYLVKQPSLIGSDLDAVKKALGEPWFYHHIDSSKNLASEGTHLPEGFQLGADDILALRYNATTVFGTKGTHWVWIKANVVGLEIYDCDDIGLRWNENEGIEQSDSEMWDWLWGLSEEALAQAVPGMSWLQVLECLGVPHAFRAFVVAEDERVIQMDYRVMKKKVQLSGSLETLETIERVEEIIQVLPPEETPAAAPASEE